MEKNAYLIAHLGTGVDVKAQVVVAQLGGLFLQLPGESDLPVVGNRGKHLFRGTERHMLHVFRNGTCSFVFISYNI